MYCVELHKGGHVGSPLLLPFVDEVTSIDCQNWISVHDYVVINWSCTPILLASERVVDGGTTDKLTAIIMKVAKTYSGLFGFEIQEKLITFGTNEVSTFIGPRPRLWCNSTTSTLVT